MRTIWTEVARGDVAAQWSERYAASMNTKGEISISRRAWQNMGEPQAFLLMFDQTNNRIGLKPATKSTRNAYPLSANGRSGGKRIRAFRLLREFGVKLTQTIKFVDPEPDEDGILILDLRTAVVSNLVKNHWSRRRDGEKVRG